MGGRDQRERRRLHRYLDVDGVAKPRAAFAGEPEAHAAANRVFNLTGRRYSAYRCTAGGCEAWHIRPCRRRPAEMARPA
jgi:hypothetical protein